MGWSSRAPSPPAWSAWIARASIPPGTKGCTGPSGDWYYYDQETSHLTCPQSKGELKRVQRLLPDGEDNDYLYWKTSETAYTYDDYGNRTSETVYAGYGQMR